MELIILGSGTCVPSLERSAPANFVRAGNSMLLVDCGSSTLKQLVKADIDYKKIDTVFITHFHIDHTADICPLIQALNWTPGFYRQKTLTLVGPQGFGHFYKKYIKPIGGIPRPDTFEIYIYEIKDHLDFSGFRVEAYKTQHSEESVAYKFIEGKKSLVISGDCDYDEGLANFAKGSDVLLLECSFPNDKKMNGHLVPRECGLIARTAEVGKLVLTHMYPPFPGTERLEETRQIFPETVLAEDLMEIYL